MTTTRCTLTSAEANEPMAGTAPTARGWLAIEQTGPWGHDALTESHLDNELGAALATLAEECGIKVLLMRRPGRRAEDQDALAPRVAWLAHSAPGRVWLRRLEFQDPAELLELDLAAVGAGEEPLVGVREDLPVMLVCTNAKRDQCCAVEGRPAAQAGALAYPDRVWECSHLGGHRFAATAVVLPHGFVHGRLDPETAPALLGTANVGRIDLGTLRGRSCWDRPGQAAEAHVRQNLGLDGADDVTEVRTTAEGPDQWSVEVVLATGEQYTVPVHDSVDDAVQRPESCVKSAIPLRTYAVGALTTTR